VTKRAVRNQLLQFKSGRQKDYPPRQTPGPFNLEKIQKQFETPIAGQSVGM
jgi:hypothetical protein